MREEEKINAGILFCPGDPELVAIKRKTHNLNVDYNNTYEDEIEKELLFFPRLPANLVKEAESRDQFSFTMEHTRKSENIFLETST